MNNRHQLKIVVPVSMSDVHLLEPWVNAFRAVGGAKNHPVVFVPTPAVAAAAKDAAQAIKNFAASVELVTTDRDWDWGWPRACNAHWSFAIRHLHMNGNTLPWLWCELDMPPLAQGFADSLIQEYILTGGRGQMGVIMPMVKFRADGYAHVDKSDPYMVGVGIYDPQFYSWMGGVSDQMWRSKFPFDTELRYYAARAWRSTNLISTASRTVGYREVGGEIVFDDITGKKDYELRAGSVPHGTVLHHGCKDKTLFQMIVASSGRPWQTIDEMLSNIASEVPKVAPEPVAPPPSRLAPSQTVPVEESYSDRTLAMAFANAKAQHPEPKIMPSISVPVGLDPAFAEQGDGGPPQPPSEPAVAEQGQSGVTAQDLARAVSEAAKPMKVANFAIQLGTTEDHIKSLAKSPGSGVNIVGGVWLKVAS